MYEALCTLVKVAVLVLIFSLLLRENLDWTQFKLLAVFAGLLVVCVPLWMMLYNRGNVSITEYGVELDEKGFRYIYYDTVQATTWDDYDGYAVKGLVPRKIVIYSKREKPIAFSYYTFSAEQRRELFQALASV